MIQSSDDVETYLREGQSILGKGWKEVESFEELEDADEYESEDEASRAEKVDSIKLTNRKYMS